MITGANAVSGGLSCKGSGWRSRASGRGCGYVLCAVSGAFSSGRASSVFWRCVCSGQAAVVDCVGDSYVCNIHVNCTSACIFIYEHMCVFGSIYVDSLCANYFTYVRKRVFSCRVLLINLFMRMFIHARVYIHICVYICDCAYGQGKIHVIA